jgi:ABC-type hemin transport system substrate-binding protein
MPIKVKTQKDSLTTEVSLELPVNLSELDAMMKSIKATGKIVVVYNQGGVLGINVEQKTKATEADSAKVRDILGIATKEL